MEHQILLGIIGFAAGLFSAGGVAALLIGFGILSRYAGVTRTAGKVRVYEKAVIGGCITGEVLTGFAGKAPLWILVIRDSALWGWFAVPLLMAGGLGMGCFVGSWILALAELIHVLPVFFRKLGIITGFSWIVIFLAAGKMAGSLLYFYMRWGFAA